MGKEAEEDGMLIVYVNVLDMYNSPEPFIGVSAV